jgi:F-type H+-transporting ATPase subunit epsilon
VESLHIEIITPERVVVSDEADMVEARGGLGEFGILPGHIEFLTTLEIGEIRYMKGNTTKHLAASGGFAEVSDNRVTLLVDTAEFAEEIDMERAKRAEARAQAALKELEQEAADYRKHALALERAIARISAASRK